MDCKQWKQRFLALAVSAAMLLAAIPGGVAVAAESADDALPFAYEVGALQDADAVASAKLAADGLARVTLSARTPVTIGDMDKAQLYLRFQLRVTRTDGVTGPGSLAKVQNGWLVVRSVGNAEVMRLPSPVQNGMQSGRRIAGEWVDMLYPLTSLSATVESITAIEVADYNDFPKQNPPVSTGIVYEVRGAEIVDTSRGRDGSSMADYAASLRAELGREIAAPVDPDAYSAAMLADYRAVVAAAEGIYNDANASLSAVDQAIEDIRAARPETDEELLAALAAKVAVSFDRSLFTEDSLTAYDRAREQAERLVGVPASKRQVREAITMLDEAMEGLQTAPVPDIVYGDVDGDGAVTASDALMALQAATDKITLSVDAQAAGNADGKGGVTASDALLLLQCATGKIADVTPSPTATINPDPLTFCNPLNLNYMYSRNYYLDGTPNPDPQHITGYQSREAADPAVVIFDGEYYLFASHNEGYWVSSDLADWEYIYVDITESEACAAFMYFAPATCVVGDTLYVTHSQNGILIKTKTPRDPHSWEVVGQPDKWSDPAMYYDDPADGGDGYVYLYQGSTPTGTLTVCKLDPNNNMQKVGATRKLFGTDPDRHGWEVAGEDNKNYTGYSYIEGAWMNKYNGKYYLTYGAPTTGAAIYADGCYVADSPMGPFTYCDHNPVAYKPGGYMVGAGHGCLFEDMNGHWWKMDSVVIMTKGWERRLAIFPAAFDEAGDLYTNTVMADYPAYIPTQSADPFNHPGPGWNLLSFQKAVTASSSLRAASCAVDENMRTWWSAQTGDAGEWLRLDLGRNYPVRAVQVNFADQDIPATVYGRGESFCQRYLLEFSQDGEHWFTMVDRRGNEKDMPHDYIEFTDAVIARYLRITNEGDVPGHGKFAISGLRVFGDGQGTAPAAVTGFKAKRDEQDGRSVTLTWQKAPDAQGYIVRYGVKEDALHLHYQVPGNDTLTINGLTKGVDYFFTVDAYNESGVTVGGDLLFVPAPASDTPPAVQTVTVAEIPRMDSRLQFLYGYCYLADWVGLEKTTDCSSAQTGGAREDYFFDATVTLTPINGASVDCVSFIDSCGVKFRSADGKETDMRMTAQIESDDPLRFQVHVPLSSVTTKEADWSAIKDAYMLFYLAGDYRTDNGAPNPYATMSITDAKIVQVIPAE